MLTGLRNKLGSILSFLLLPGRMKINFVLFFSLSIWKNSLLKPFGPRGSLFHPLFLVTSRRVGHQQARQVLLEK